ncbi:magnesium transporter [Rickettsiaceae bacterium]|nr:magnesium transporter [Rickettsiaceae bacterium]
MAKDQQNAISPDHQDSLLDQFDHITYLINNVKLNEAAEALLNLHHADLADFLDNANAKIAHIILRIIADKLHPETITCLNNANKQKIIEILGVKKSAEIINKLHIEDSIETINILPPGLKKSLIADLDSDKRDHVLKGFTYPDNTAGRVLKKDFVPLQQHWTAGQAIDFIRRSKLTHEFHAAIIVDTKFKPIGTILLSTLLKSSRTTHLAEIMNYEFKVANTHTEISELAFIFKQYALTVVPVTNRKGKLVGTISIDNMLYIIAEQTENEFMHLGGVNNIDIFYNLYTTAKHRFPWLFANLVIACITSLIITQFSDTISKLITLAAFMPIVSSMGGNVGTQTMTVIVRALASREITSGNSFKIVSKEILVCTFNGIILALIGMILTYLLFSDMSLSAVFACAVAINFITAGLLGSSIPIVLNNLNIDPAAASGVFLTACTDAIGFFSLLSLAYFLLV